MKSLSLPIIICCLLVNATFAQESSKNEICLSLDQIYENYLKSSHKKHKGRHAQTDDDILFTSDILEAAPGKMSDALKSLIDLYTNDNTQNKLESKFKKKHQLQKRLKKRALSDQFYKRIKEEIDEDQKEWLITNSALTSALAEFILLIYDFYYSLSKNTKISPYSTQIQKFIPLLLATPLLSHLSKDESIATNTLAEWNGLLWHYIESLRSTLAILRFECKEDCNPEFLLVLDVLKSKASLLNEMQNIITHPFISTPLGLLLNFYTLNPFSNYTPLLLTIAQLIIHKLHDAFYWAKTQIQFHDNKDIRAKLESDNNFLGYTLATMLKSEGSNGNIEQLLLQCGLSEETIKDLRTLAQETDLDILSHSLETFIELFEEQ